MEPIFNYKANAQFKGIWESKIVKGQTTEIFSEIHGPGIVQHFWLTTFPVNREVDLALANDLVLNIYWDHCDHPAVSVPLADFFCQPLKLQLINNHFFRSTNDQLLFTTTIPMPFLEMARFELINQSEREIELFFGIDVEFKTLIREAMYLHAHWQKTNDLQTGQSFNILPSITGMGRYLGTHMAVQQNNVLKNWPWYTRPITVRLDAKSAEDLPSLYIKTIDDFFGSGWWDREVPHNTYMFPHVGRSLIELDDNDHLSTVMYRYHVQEALWFHESISVEIGFNWNWGNQQIGKGDWATTAFFYLRAPGH
ncbi:MAG: DUF2961 domain-containing protein [Cytophagales bacterium]|nr:DUF2961 domain-containing protein [Cytophagales bacterium]